MTIAEKLLRAKDDIDAVYEAGYNMALFDTLPIIAQSSASSNNNPVFGQWYDKSVFTCKNILGDQYEFWDFIDAQITESSSQVTLSVSNCTRFTAIVVAYVYCKSDGEYIYVEVPPYADRSKDYTLAVGYEWEYEIKGAYFKDV